MKRYSQERKDKISQTLKDFYKSNPVVLSKEEKSKRSILWKKWAEKRVYKSKDTSELKCKKAIRNVIFKERWRICELCWWCEKRHDWTVPVQVDHIDWDTKNNKKENLRVLCPNCHSLTKKFMRYK